MGKYYNKNNEYKIKKIKLNNNSSLGYSNFYSVDGEESSLELVFKLNILRQQYIKNKNLFELLSELSIWLKDKQKLKLLILIDQEFKNLIILNSFKYDKNFDHLQKFRDKNIEKCIDNKFFNKKIKTPQIT